MLKITAIGNLTNDVELKVNETNVGRVKIFSHFSLQALA